MAAESAIPATKVSSRGIVSYFTTYRPPAPLDIYSSPTSPESKHDETHITDGVSYNYNGCAIPPVALKAILKRPLLAGLATDADVDSGDVSGIVFVSERFDSLELLHFALFFKKDDEPAPAKVFSFAELYDGAVYTGVRMEDNGCFAGESLVYISTMEPAEKRRQPWTAVYSTDLNSGETRRLTPKATADLSPSVTPSGKTVAVASYERKGGWDGEVEDLRTDIFVMSAGDPSDRKLLISNGGWPSWATENVLFFHRKEGSTWGVFRGEITASGDVEVTRVTPADIDAVTPAAIDASTVAVATIRKKYSFSEPHRDDTQYRHIEIFDSGSGESASKLTVKMKPHADHFNPFVLDAGRRIGYHRCNHTPLLTAGDIFRTWDLSCFESMLDGVSLFRAPGAFPAFFRDGSKLAFVDNEFKSVSVVDHASGLRKVYETEGNNGVWSPVWNQNPNKNVLYICRGNSFNAHAEVNIIAIAVDIAGAVHSTDLKGDGQSVHARRGVNALTDGANNAFPSTNPEGTKLVFRSTRDDVEKKGYKNLYIMDLVDDADAGQTAGKITRFSNGKWMDTHCEWSPNGKWIVFSSSRDKPAGAAEFSIDHDAGYFAAFIARADDPAVVVRVVISADDVAGHVNHPYFSPDGKSLVFASDLAGVSADPMSMPLFLHSARPYGDIFTVDVDPEDIEKNRNLATYTRMTHSRYENGTCTWTLAMPEFLQKWEHTVTKDGRPAHAPACPYLHPEHGGESYHMTGHLFVPNTKC